MLTQYCTPRRRTHHSSKLFGFDPPPPRYPIAVGLWLSQGVVLHQKENGSNANLILVTMWKYFTSARRGCVLSSMLVDTKIQIHIWILIDTGIQVVLMVAITMTTTILMIAKWTPMQSQFSLFDWIQHNFGGHYAHPFALSSQASWSKFNQCMFSPWRSTHGHISTMIF